VVAHSEGERVVVNGDSALRWRRGQGQRQWCDSVYGLRMRTAAVRSEAMIEAVTCSEARDEAVVCSCSGSRTAGGGGMTVSGVTEERESAQGRKISKCGKRECGA
jgi:hypothetical protein